MTPEKKEQYLAWIDWVLVQRLLVDLGATEIEKGGAHLTFRTKEGRWTFRPRGDTWPFIYARAVKEILKEER